MGDRGDPGRTVDVRSHVSLVADVRRARVDAHSHPDRAAAAARAAPLRRASRASGAVGKATKKASPCVSTSTPPCARAASRTMPPVLRQRLGVALGTQLVQEPRRSLDVREQEGDGAGGKIALHRPIVISRRRARAGSGRAGDSPRTRGTARRGGAPRRATLPAHRRPSATVRPRPIQLAVERGSPEEQEDAEVGGIAHDPEGAARDRTRPRARLRAGR